MAQFDFTTADGPIVGTKSFPNTRADINSALLALISNSSGDAEPTGTQANQFWYETDTNILKIRNEANDGWINVLTLDESMTVSASELNLLDDLTRGSILYGNASGATARLAKGGADTVLTSDGTDISWAAGGGGGAIEFITSSGAISNAATVDFTQFDSTKYDSYQFRFIDILPVDDDVELRARTSSDTSSHVYDTGAADYIKTGDSSVTAAFGQLAANKGIGNGTQERSNLVVDVLNPHTANYTRVRTGGMLSRSQGYPSGLGTSTDVFARAEAAQVNAIRFFLESGNIASGEITMYGIKNS